MPLITSKEYDEWIEHLTLEDLDLPEIVSEFREPRTNDDKCISYWDDENSVTLSEIKDERSKPMTNDEAKEIFKRCVNNHPYP